MEDEYEKDQKEYGSGCAVAGNGADNGRHSG